MVKAFALVKRFGLFAQKDKSTARKEDMFSLRLQRLQRMQAMTARTQLFRTTPSHQEV